MIKSNYNTVVFSKERISKNIFPINEYSIENNTFTTHFNNIIIYIRILS